MAWRLAKSIDKLRCQVNDLYPTRSKSADGTIGDAAHRARKSDHNPNSAGVVTACDITHDPKSGCDAGVLAAVLIASRDPRIDYIIWNRQIIAGERGPSPWKPRAYKGGNPHTMHVHISVHDEKRLSDDERPWAMPGAIAPKVPTAPQPKHLDKPTLMRGNTGDGVKELQRALGFTGKDVDGLFGPATEKAVRAFQAKHNLGVDGKVGQYTWAALLGK